MSLKNGSCFHFALADIAVASFVFLSADEYADLVGSVLCRRDRSHGFADAISACLFDVGRTANLPASIYSVRLQSLPFERGTGRRTIALETIELLILLSPSPTDVTEILSPSTCDVFYFISPSTSDSNTHLFFSSFPFAQHRRSLGIPFETQSTPNDAIVICAHEQLVVDLTGSRRERHAETRRPDDETAAHVQSRWETNDRWSRARSSRA